MKQVICKKCLLFLSIHCKSMGSNFHLSFWVLQKKVSHTCFEQHEGDFIWLYQECSNQHTYTATWVPFTQAVPNLTPPCGEAGALATYLLYHRPPLRLRSLWCNWEWGYGSVPAQQCPTAVAESMTIHAAQQPWKRVGWGGQRHNQT